MDVTRIRDYQSGTDRQPDGSTLPRNIPQGDLLVFQLSATGFRAAVRPSGTEPKIKFYLFGFTPPDALNDLAAAKMALREQLLLIHDDFMKATGLAVEIA